MVYFYIFFIRGWRKRERKLERERIKGDIGKRGEKGAIAEGERRGRRGYRVGEGETEMGEERRVDGDK